MASSLTPIPTQSGACYCKHLLTARKCESRITNTHTHTHVHTRRAPLRHAATISFDSPCCCLDLPYFSCWWLHTLKSTFSCRCNLAYWRRVLSYGFLSSTITFLFVFLQRFSSKPDGVECVVISLWWVNSNFLVLRTHLLWQKNSLDSLKTAFPDESASVWGGRLNVFVARESVSGPRVVYGLQNHPVIWGQRPQKLTCPSLSVGRWSSSCFWPHCWKPICVYHCFLRGNVKRPLPVYSVTEPWKRCSGQLNFILTRLEVFQHFWATWLKHYLLMNIIQLNL